MAKRRRPTVPYRPVADPGTETGPRRRISTLPPESGPHPRVRSSAPPPSQPRMRHDSAVLHSHLTLEHTPIDDTLLAGAENALRVVLGLRSDDRLVLLIEVGYESIGAALQHVAREMGLELQVVVLDAARSERESFLKRLDSWLDDAHGSLLVGSRTGLPMSFRRRVLVPRSKRRHGHMVGITEAMMRQSMRVDYEEIHALGEAILAELRGAEDILVRGAGGSELRVKPDPRCRWHNGSGLLRSTGFTNLPAGEVVTTPRDVRGRILPDAGVWLEDGRVLRGGRLQLHFERGQLARAEGVGASEIISAADADPNGARVGQIAFGTNLGVLTPIGAMLQDLKMPGVHLVLGYSCPEQTGARWSSEVMIPILLRRPDVLVDDKPLMVRGRYARHLLP